MRRKNSYQLVAELINNGLRPVLVDIEVVFAEGNPDADGDYIVDEDADILGTVVVKATDWEGRDIRLAKRDSYLRPQDPA